MKTILKKTHQAFATTAFRAHIGLKQPNHTATETDFQDAWDQLTATDKAAYSIAGEAIAAVVPLQIWVMVKTAPVIMSGMIL